MERMIYRHMDGEPYNFICITDSPKEQFSEHVNVYPTPHGAHALSDLRSPEGPRFPSCYRRLWMFSEEARALGSRCLLLDIDIVVTRSLAPLFDLPGEFVGWYPYRDWGIRRKRFGGGIYVITPGTRVAVYEKFIESPRSAIQYARRLGYRGSDQGWISCCLAESEPYMPRSAGVYSVRDPGVTRQGAPLDARLIQFNGTVKPWQSDWPWVRSAWA